jgi:U2-associated protein SR140
MAKMFVKGAIINGKEELAADARGALYKPALKLAGKSFATPTSSPAAKVGESPLNASLGAASPQSEVQARARRHEKEKKKKSNLELFKEELKRLQIERDEKTRRREEGGVESDANQPDSRPMGEFDAFF